MDMLDNIHKPVHWWGQSIARIDFLLGTTLTFGAWALLGAYRTMCNELEIRTTPWALPAFIAFFAVYATGFTVRGESNNPHILFGIFASGVVISGGFSYLMLFADKSGATAWQRLRVRLRARQWHRALQESPLWLVALATGLTFALGATLTSTGNGTGTGTFLHEVGLAPIAVMLFAVRDAAIFQFFALARQPRRVAAATMIYLILLYGIVPGLLKVMGADFVADLILPPLFTKPALATAIILVHVGIAIALAHWRWRTTHAPDTDGPLAPAP